MLAASALTGPAAPHLQKPERQATVEVACALEGLACCLSASLAQSAEGGAGAEAAAAERQRQERYAESACVAARFLLRAQVHWQG